MSPFSLRRFFLILLVAFSAVACSKVSLDNYARLKTGQSYEEVVAVLGSPERCDETLGVRQCLWGSENRGIKVGFVGGMALTISAHNLK